MKTRREFVRYFTTDFSKLVLFFPLLKLPLFQSSQAMVAGSTAEILTNLALGQNCECAYFSRGINMLQILKSNPNLVHKNIHLNDDLNVTAQDILDQIQDSKLSGVSIHFVIIENHGQPATVIQFEKAESLLKTSFLS